jgi:hypothetical protein
MMSATVPQFSVWLVRCVLPAAGLTVVKVERRRYAASTTDRHNTTRPAQAQGAVRAEDWLEKRPLGGRILYNT